MRLASEKRKITGRHFWRSGVRVHVKATAQRRTLCYNLGSGGTFEDFPKSEESRASMLLVKRLRG